MNVGNNMNAQKLCSRACCSRGPLPKGDDVALGIVLHTSSKGREILKESVHTNKRSKPPTACAPNSMMDSLLIQITNPVPA
jgi:hypothetical protein